MQSNETHRDGQSFRSLRGKKSRSGTTLYPRGDFGLGTPEGAEGEEKELPKTLHECHSTPAAGRFGLEKRVIILVWQGKRSERSFFCIPEDSSLLFGFPFPLCCWTCARSNPENAQGPILFTRLPAACEDAHAGATVKSPMPVSTILQWKSYNLCLVQAS
jgi:hypothetical protein